MDGHFDDLKWLQCLIDYSLYRLSDAVFPYFDTDIYLSAWKHLGRIHKSANTAVAVSLADRTDGRAYATVLRLSVVCRL